MCWVMIWMAFGLLLLQAGGMVRPAGPTAFATPVAVSAQPRARVDFDAELKPIFQSQCMPCHFSGGTMYETLPFDKPATIRKLGTRLFTRIKAESDRRLIEEFLAQKP